MFEQAVELEAEGGRRLPLRRIELHLDEPTEDGDTCIQVLTNVPAERMAAKEVVGLYQRRWSIKGMFGRLESVLKSEVSSLGYPRAELLAFGVAVMAYNVLAVLLAAAEGGAPPVGDGNFILLRLRRGRGESHLQRNDDCHS